jgi:hypothetical protein
MYWTIPETAVAVLCACLPTMRAAFSKLSPESLINSIRSMMSLHSETSQRRNTDGSGDRPKNPDATSEEAFIELGESKEERKLNVG